jgi:hypothetical protein
MLGDAMIVTKRHQTFGFQRTRGILLTKNKQTNKLLATQAMVCTQISRPKSNFSGCNEEPEIVRKLKPMSQLACRPGVCQDGSSHETPATTAGQPAAIQLQILDT